MFGQIDDFMTKVHLEGFGQKGEKNEQSFLQFFSQKWEEFFAAISSTAINEFFRFIVLPTFISLPGEIKKMVRQRWNWEN